MKPLKLFIVDDEPPAVERMTSLLADMPDVEIVGCESRSDRVLERCVELAPDAILLDIEMPGLDGMQLATRIHDLKSPPQIIFVTAYEDYAVDAFGLEAVDYLVKPVRPGRLQQALKRLQPESAYLESAHLAARIGDRLIRLPLQSVRVLVASDKCVIAHSLDGQSLLDGSLKQIEEQYPGHFVRVHRNALVSRSHIRSVYRNSDGIERVEIEGTDVQPEISRRNRGELKRWLKQS